MAKSPCIYRTKKTVYTGPQPSYAYDCKRGVNLVRGGKPELCVNDERAQKECKYYNDFETLNNFDK